MENGSLYSAVPPGCGLALPMICCFLGQFRLLAFAQPLMLAAIICSWKYQTHYLPSGALGGTRYNAFHCPPVLSFLKIALCYVHRCLETARSRIAEELTDTALLRPQEIAEADSVSGSEKG